MKNSCNLLFLLIICFFISGKLNAQETLTPNTTFHVVSKQNTSDAALAAKCVEKSDFNNYRLRDARRKLTFDNGVVIELFSAVELKNLGYNIDPNFYDESIDKKNIEPTYSITANGDLIQNHIPSAKFKGQ